MLSAFRDSRRIKIGGDEIHASFRRPHEAPLRRFVLQTLLQRDGRIHGLQSRRSHGLGGPQRRQDWQNAAG